MSNYAYPIKEIIYDKEIQDFNTSGLFSALVNQEYKEILCITEDMLDDAYKELMGIKAFDIYCIGNTWTYEELCEAREQCEYYKKLIKEKNLEYLEFHCY